MYLDCIILVALDIIDISSRSIYIYKSTSRVLGAGYYIIVSSLYCCP